MKWQRRVEPRLDSANSAHSAVLSDRLGRSRFELLRKRRDSGKIPIRTGQPDLRGRNWLNRLPERNASRRKAHPLRLRSTRR